MNLKKEDLESLEKKLIKEKENLNKILSDFATKSSENNDDWNTKFPNFQAKGALDEEADEVEEYSSLLPIERAMEVKLHKINEALEKIKKNEYGTCKDCGKEIEINRLELIPEANLCTKCKR